MTGSPDTRTREVEVEEPRHEADVVRDVGGSAAAGPTPPRPRGHSGYPDDEVAEISLLELVNVLLKRWKLVVGLPLVAAIIAAIIALLLPPSFTATATFVPEQEQRGLNLPSGLAGLAAQFGVSVPLGGSAGPVFYADVLGSRTLRDQLLLAEFLDPRMEDPDDAAPLIDILEVEGEGELDRLEKGRRLLSGALTTAVDRETNVVSVSVELARYPGLAAAVANEAVNLLSRFNTETRQSNAQERRRFVEERMEKAEAELTAAEDELKRFLERNRQFSDSPQLTVEYERLQRQVTSKQEVFTMLRRSYEEARIQEVNDTPVITVIDRAVPPMEKSSPKRKLMVILAFMLGGVLSVFGAFGKEFVERARVREEAEYEELTSRWAAIKRELKGMLRPRRRSGE